MGGPPPGSEAESELDSSDDEDPLPTLSSSDDASTSGSADESLPLGPETESLVEQALEAGGKDNITLILARVVRLDQRPDKPLADQQRQDDTVSSPA